MAMTPDPTNDRLIAMALSNMASFDQLKAWVRDFVNALDDAEGLLAHVYADDHPVRIAANKLLADAGRRPGGAYPTVYEVKSEFGSGRIEATPAAIRTLLEQAVWIADDLRRHRDDPMNMDWMDDADTIWTFINYQPKGRR